MTGLHPRRRLVLAATTAAVVVVLIGLVFVEWTLAVAISLSVLLFTVVFRWRGVGLGRQNHGRT